MKRRNTYTAIYKKVRGGYTAWVEEIPGVNTQGKTLREAKENLRDALTLMLEANRVLNRTIGKVVREIVTI